MIIVDMGSGETCRNDTREIARMIYALKQVDTGKHEVVIKWQLFESIPPLKPLTVFNFSLARQIASDMGYQTTASVFDDASIAFLLSEGVPWIKIAARPHLYHYVDDYPDTRFVVSVAHPQVTGIWDIFGDDMGHRARLMYCVPEYPATSSKYESLFGENLHVGISDHTPDFRLFRRYRPMTYEAHFKMPDSTGADSGPWARTPEQWAEIL
jgi:hypothetical protein